MRSHEQVVWDFVQQWLKKADSDLKSAKILLDAETDDYFTCAFHCQQSAEKFLKAYLVRYQIEFRKTHDLSELLNLVKTIDQSLYDEISPCVWLTPYGVEFRYPGEYPDVNHNTAQRTYEESKIVEKGVMKRLEDYLSRGMPD